MTIQVPDDITPMMRQYRRMKQIHPEALLLFRVGDFYEMFFDDARTASKVLSLTLTSRDKGENAVPMAGVPHHAVDTYVKRLVEAGYKVAICDQVEDPALAKGLVKRDVTRLVTPGTLTEDSLLGSKDHNFLAGVFPLADAVGLAWVDMSTGCFSAEDVMPAQLADELARLAPSECLLPEEGVAEETLALVRPAIRGMITLRPAWAFGRDTAMRALLEHFRVKTLDGFGCGDLGPSASAAGAIIQYLQETQKINLSHIRTLTPFGRRSRLLIDRATQTSLELTRTARDGSLRGSLLWVLDRTRTPMGGRLLKEWLLCPQMDVPSIRERQDHIQDFVKDHALRQEIRGALDGIYDIERLSTRISCGRGNARDLVSLKQSLSALPMLKERLARTQRPSLTALSERMDLVEEARVLIATAIAPDPPVALGDGGIIRDGYSPDLDELRAIKRTGRDWIASFQAREAERTGIASLKVGYNKVFGYYIEVTNTHQEKVPPEYVRKQTLKNAERYITPQLKEYETRVLTADDRAKELEYTLFLEIREKVAVYTDRLQRLATAIADTDVLTCLADVAVERNYVRPEVDDSLQLEIVNGRHPVLECALEEEFVPNDIHMDSKSGFILILTGPNMAGKSTYIRQVALIVIMAQMGSYVPATQARIGVADRVFTRVGASDELAQGMSTFMLEMTETANILNNASERSLLILDEVGRGTSTFDGVSIAWATAEYIREHVKARTLFATHYHELTELGRMYPGIRNYNVAVKEWGGEIIFLRKIAEGATDKSYGIHVARLAGLPREVIERAKLILQNLEAQTLDAEDKPRFAKNVPKGRKQVQIQLNMFALDDKVGDELRRLKIEKLTPIQALAKLEELKRLAER
jgi:DNA mismatch repair protein MutS